MNILKQLNFPEFKVTKSDRQLIKYIKENKEAVIYKSISEIANDNNIGEATVTRFTKKMGFLGFQDFKVTLATEISNKSTKRIINNNIDNNESVEETSKKLLQCNIDVLQQTNELINFKDIHICSEYIKEASRVYFFGIGYSGIIALDSNYKFMRIGVNSCSYQDSHTIMMMASIANKDDLVIAISHTGETDEIIKAVNLVKENGCKVISITQDKPSRLKDVSDINLSYVSAEIIFETGAVSSKLAQIYLIDLVYTQVVKDMDTTAIERKVRTTEAIDQLRNV
ncbi:MurR/RpiR family transcriptional regulator [Clostridium chauvoei]|uniref:MurR/RpiR family transcriptional regulator n=1 Tax=Clostridium chauvoei TaxID=46867 RepID=UPI001C84D3ED|nr:MurR/RpiR family transcriptional regulator [Clostridium chauvoei]MBX7360134.1 MurR/RpiR family transcriptional regulator [Clostridium chauvoei]